MTTTEPGNQMEKKFELNLHERRFSASGIPQRAMSDVMGPASPVRSIQSEMLHKERKADRRKIGLRGAVWSIVAAKRLSPKKQQQTPNLYQDSLSSHQLTPASGAYQFGSSTICKNGAPASARYSPKGLGKFKIAVRAVVFCIRIFRFAMLTRRSKHSASKSLSGANMSNGEMKQNFTRKPAHLGGNIQQIAYPSQYVEPVSDDVRYLGHLGGSTEVSDVLNLLSYTVNFDKWN